GATMLLYANGFGWNEVGRTSGDTNVLTESLWQYSGGYLQPVDLTQPLFWTNSINWGATNVMRRIQGYWELTNASPGLKLTATGNYQSILTNRSDVATLIAGGASSAVSLVDG